MKRAPKIAYLMKQHFAEVFGALFSFKNCYGRNIEHPLCGHSPKSQTRSWKWAASKCLWRKLQRGGAQLWPCPSGKECCLNRYTWASYLYPAPIPSRAAILSGYDRRSTQRAKRRNFFRGFVRYCYLEKLVNLVLYVPKPLTLSVPAKLCYPARDLDQLIHDVPLYFLVIFCYIFQHIIPSKVKFCSNKRHQNLVTKTH